MRALRANLAAEATHHRLGRADRVEFTEFDLYPDRPPAAAADPAVFHVGPARVVGRLPTGQPQPAGPVPPAVAAHPAVSRLRSEEHTSELQALMRHTYAVVCLH